MIEIIYTSKVRRDQKRIIDWFAAEDAVDAALRFIDAMDATASFIAEFPELGNPWESSNPRLEGLCLFSARLLVYAKRLPRLPVKALLMNAKASMAFFLHVSNTELVAT